MYNKTTIVRTSSVLLTMGIIIGGTSAVWGAEIDANQPQVAVITTPQATVVKTPQTPTNDSIPLVDDRILTIGIGTIGGVALYSYLMGGWGGAVRISRAGIPVAARLGANWGGRWIFATASGVVGALVADWIYRNNQAAK